MNAISLGLLISSKVLGGKNAQVAKTLRTLIQRLGEPVIRAAVTQAIRQMGDQFVLGETIESAQKRAKKLEKLFEYKLETFEIAEIKDSKNRLLKSKLRRSRSIPEVNLYAMMIVKESIENEIDSK